MRLSRFTRGVSRGVLECGSGAVATEVSQHFRGGPSCAVLAERLSVTDAGDIDWRLNRVSQSVLSIKSGG